ncbi:Trm5p [Sugiyamaella lignohabitans]|uniref:tRNA (guanine(37)-N1)-methyltransferase n=1 Tax=Sugiyamaella lignohabitans TaxID=796027 RepID=A0A167CUU4_9ASCO|nr:Trm5p [Sugiyamaella lignohabitans]ANB12132.1 Trm5p [Sugiyamaella lignohabitans]
MSASESVAKKQKTDRREWVRDFHPPVHRGMMELDKSAFTVKVPLVAALLKDQSFFASLVKNSRSDLLQLQGISRIVEWENNQKAILLRHDINSPDKVPQAVTPTTLDVLTKAEATYHPYTLNLDYDYWRAEDILESVLPEDLLNEVPTGFTVVGHIAHMNIREEYMPYRFLIGQVILDKNPLVETVVNKLDSIHAVYRTFDMEVLAGKEEFEVEQSESGCRFRFNFKAVYWNSRLHTEHARLISQFNKGEAVCDVFAGVGPFAVPAGKKGVIVFANDLNPHSYESMVGNIKLNKVDRTVFPTNEDGREYIKKSSQMLVDFAAKNPVIEIPPKRVSRSKPETSIPEKIPVPTHFKHYVMNLPDSAIEFLDGFIGLYRDLSLRQAAFGTDTPTSQQMPIINVHCFHKHEPDEPEPEPAQIHEDLRARVSKNLSFQIALSELSFHKVRKVAPTKTMYCISFRLPLPVALA